MSIWIDITHLQDVKGKNVLYYPSVHWEIADNDTIGPEKMEAIRRKVQKVLEDELI